jgi:hypothetical protein
MRLGWGRLVAVAHLWLGDHAAAVAKYRKLGGYQPVDGESL